MSGRASSRKVIFAALAGNTLIAVTKFAAAFITGSSAMLSEGVHSVVDTGNQILLLYGLHRAKKPPDEAFPFGHGKEVYFWSFVVAILIFAVGAGVSVYEGVQRISHPEPMTRPLVNYTVLGLALLFEGAAWVFAMTEFTRSKGKWGYIEAVRRGKDPSIFMVLFEDSAAILGILVAGMGIGLGQWFKMPIFDGVASILIGMILGGTAIWLAHETKGLLIGESAERDVVDGIRRIAGSFAGVKHVNEVLTMHMGPDFILVNLSVDFEDDLTAAQVESAVAALDDAIKTAYPAVKRVFVEAEARRSAAKGGETPEGADTLPPRP